MYLEAGQVPGKEDGNKFTSLHPPARGGLNAV